MLVTLLRTRLRYYHNYLRHHFDRVVWLEIGLIVLLFFYLAGRSPADIGYNLKFLQAADFSFRYASQWAALLPLFYLIAEILALITLRPAGEWQILGALPIHQQAITNYHLLRHLGKIFGLFLLGTVPFLIGSGSIAGKTLRYSFALSALLALQLAGFIQAGVLRNAHERWPRKLRRWLPLEAAIIFLLVIGAPWWRNLLMVSTSQTFLGVLLAWSLALLLLFYIHHTHRPGHIETGVSRDREVVKPHREFSLSSRMGITAALIFHDMQFLWRCKHSVFVYLFITAGITGMACMFQKSAEEAYASSIVIAIISNLLLVNALLVYSIMIPAPPNCLILPIEGANFVESQMAVRGGIHGDSHVGSDFNHSP
jgi:hypothetical protein